MKKFQYLMIAILLLTFTLAANSYEPASKREELLRKIDQLASWCEENNEHSSAIVLYTLSGSLLMNDDSTLATIAAKYSEQAIKAIKNNKTLPTNKL